MKTSITNKGLSTGVTISSGSIAEPGELVENALDPDIRKHYAVEGNLDLTIDNLGDIDADMIGIFDVSFDANFVLSLYDNLDVLIETVTFTSSDWTGWKIKNLIYEPSSVSADLEKITITTTGAAIDKFIGYIWIGDWVDFECEEAIQPFSQTDDKVKITRSNRPDLNTSYRFRAFNVTLSKLQDFKDIRDKVESIIDDGFGKGRPLYFDNRPFNGELYYAILDSPKVGYDFFDISETADEFTGQITIGVREVT